MDTTNSQNIPTEIAASFTNVADQASSLLGARFIGLYVHGSLAMGCFNPSQSDIDFLIVTDGALSSAERQSLARVVTAARDQVPTAIEMSAVQQLTAGKATVPTPYELHVDTRRRAEPSAGGSVVLGGENDPDLLAHFMVIRQRGIVWRGKPIPDVFGEVPRPLFVKALLYDLGDLNGNLHSNPVYGILNACRTLAYLAEGKILSKREGGNWAVSWVDQNFQPLIREALRVHVGDSREMTVDPLTAAAFVRYVATKVEDLK